MAARFIDTELWSEDWFCELGVEHQLFWVYVTNQCNNAGVWKPNKIDFEIKSRVKINMDAFLQKVNERGCTERIIITATGRWFLTGFVKFQWFNKIESFDLVLTNRLHKHIHTLLVKDKVNLKKIRGLREVLETSKDKVKDKDSNKGGMGGKEKGNEFTEPQKIEFMDIPTSDFKNYSIDQLKWSYLNGPAHQKTREAICMNRRLTVQDLEKKCQEFVMSCKESGKHQTSMTDFVKHFRNWISLQKDQPVKSPKTVKI